MMTFIIVNKDVKMSKKYNFDYLIDKIRNKNFETKPWKHVYIESWLSDEHFEEIIAAPEIRLQEANSDKELFKLLSAQSYKPITFPGCTTDVESYIAWHAKKDFEVNHRDTIEAFGMALRLFEPKTQILKTLDKFLSGVEFNSAICQKFGIDYNFCKRRGGIQKYLDGYEISPHVDIRKKAATFMVNINPVDDSESINYHTHYLKFKPQWDFIREYWKNNPKVDTCWVPWECAETEKLQTKNNSIVLFSPASYTLHAVKASYNHLKTQRTQLYGNIWYNESFTTEVMGWKNFANMQKNAKKL